MYICMQEYNLIQITSSINEKLYDIICHSTEFMQDGFCISL